jgi:MFS family permease
MNREPSPVKFRRMLLAALVAAALGTALGTIAGPWLLDRYRDSPPWFIPVLVLGCALLAVCGLFVLGAHLHRRSAANSQA